jgi:carboxypeptidase PM20D1
MPGVSIADVKAHIHKVAGKQKVEVNVLRGNEASPYSLQSGTAYETIRRLVQSEHPNSIFAPYLVMGGTDSRYYAPLCRHCYRFSPFVVPLSLLTTTHGTNERCPVAALAPAVSFFIRYIRAVSSYSSFEEEK